MVTMATGKSDDLTAATGVHGRLRYAQPGEHIGQCRILDARGRRRDPDDASDGDPAWEPSTRSSRSSLQPRMLITVCAISSTQRDTRYLAVAPY